MSKIRIPTWNIYGKEYFYGKEVITGTKEFKTKGKSTVNTNE